MMPAGFAMYITSEAGCGSRVNRRYIMPARAARRRQERTGPLGFSRPAELAASSDDPGCLYI